MPRITASVIAAATAEAQRLGVEPAALCAVVQIESGGVVFAAVEGRNEPLIRFEGHYLDRRLKGAVRDAARRAGLAHPEAGKIKNPKDQPGRYRMLTRAFEYGAAEAIESCSWGVGQVMGAHWQWLKYTSAADLMNSARSGVAGQIGLMGRFVERAGLVGALQRRDWPAFARGYNGPAYRKNKYDTKLAAAYASFASGSPIVPADKVPSASGMLRLASKGARVRELQHLLVRAGHPVNVDGDYGPATHAAVQAFQRAAGLEVDGVAGPQTMRALERYRQGAADRPGQQAISELAEVRGGVAGGVGGGIAAEVASQQLESVADRLAYIPGLETIAAGLGIVAAVLVLGGLAYAGYGWWRSGRTVESPA